MLGQKYRSIVTGSMMAFALCQIGCGKSQENSASSSQSTTGAAQPQPVPDATNPGVPVAPAVSQTKKPYEYTPILEKDPKSTPRGLSDSASRKTTRAPVQSAREKAMTGSKFHDATLPPNAVPDPNIKPKTKMDLDNVLVEVAKRWPTVTFMKDGKVIHYAAKLETNLGDIEFELLPEMAPNHVRNFVILCQIGFYDGLIIHRVVPGHVIQGGCPYGTGEGDAGYWMKSEFNNLSYKRGVISMPRGTDFNSGSCQFFVCVADRPQLNNKFTGFGKVTNGIETVDKIVACRRHPNDKPFDDVIIKKASAWILETKTTDSTIKASEPAAASAKK